MKIIIFNDDREIIEQIEDVRDAEAVSSKEATWQGGGISHVEHSFIIVEDGIELKDVSEEQIVEQLKYQNKLELAREYTEERIKALAEGTEQEYDEAFLAAREKMNSIKGLAKNEAQEAFVRAKQEFNNRGGKHGQEVPNEHKVPANREFVDEQALESEKNNNANE